MLETIEVEHRQGERRRLQLTKILRGEVLLPPLLHELGELRVVKHMLQIVVKGRKDYDQKLHLGQLRSSHSTYLIAQVLHVSVIAAGI